MTHQRSAGAVDGAQAAKPRVFSLEDLVMAALLVVWAVPYLHGVGGRDAHAARTMAIASAIAVPLMRPWRIGWRPALLALALAGAALTACLVDATGWYGADVASGYVIAAAVGLCALTYVRQTGNATMLAGAVCLGAFYELGSTIVSWIQVGDPTLPLNGAFFWYNPFAAYVLPAALLGLAFVFASTKGWLIVGWIAAPTAVAGVVLSTSRATLAVLVVGWLVIIGLLVRDKATAIRAAAVTALAAAVTFVLPGHPFFSHWHSPFDGAAARAASGETLTTSGTYRTEFWREALKVFAHHPLTGGGFHSLASDSVLYTPGGWARSQLAHNGILQALSDGGLFLAVPLVLAVLIAVFWAAKALLGSIRDRAASDPIAVAASIALLGGLAHSLVDFDWSHPVILVEFVLLATVLWSPKPTVEASAGPSAGDADADADADARPARRSRVPELVLAVLVVGALVFSAASLNQWIRDTPFGGAPAATYLADSSASFGDYRPAELMLSLQVQHPGFATPPQILAALQDTAKASKADLSVELVRLAALASIGDPDAVTEADSLIGSLSGNQQSWNPQLAIVRQAAATYRKTSP